MLKINLLKFRWLLWHRRLGLITCLGILLWALSGLSHPIMSRLQPVPVAFNSPPQQLSLKEAVAPSIILTQEKITQFNRLSVVSLNDKTYYRITEKTQQPARLFLSTTKDITEDRELIDGDKIYAKKLASHYTGLSESSIADARFITEFSDDYHAVNQLLPVWRIEFAGHKHLRAFIDTDQARLATLVDDTRYNLTKLFMFGHNWSFAEGFPRLQISIMASVLGIVLLSACSGLYLYVRQIKNVKQRLAQNQLRYWHRKLGLFVAISTLLFASSGFLHLVVSYKQSHEALKVDPNAVIYTSQLSNVAWQKLTIKPTNKIDIVSYQGQPMWLIQDTMPKTQVASLAQESHHHGHHLTEDKQQDGTKLISATDADIPVNNVIELSKTQAAKYAKQSLNRITHAEVINKFEGEYGFLFKRLPVVKVQFSGAGNPRFYIESSTGALAAVVTDNDATEGWIFAYLHKWNFIFFSKDLRDALVILFALANILLAGMGLVMFSKK